MKRTQEINQSGRPIHPVRRVVILLFFLSIVQCCIDPQAVQDFATSSLQTINLLSFYASDMEQSCKRTGLAADQASWDCIHSEKAKTSVLAVQAILKDYINNLGRLADKDNVTFSDDLDALEEEVKNLKAFDGDKVTAVRNVGAALGTAAVSGYTRKMLREIVTDTDPSVRLVLGGLKEFLDDQYRDQLNHELTALEGRKADVKADYGEKEPLACEIETRSLDLQILEVKKKEKSIDACRSGLEQIAKAHHELSFNAAHLDAKELIKAMKEYAKEIRKLNKEVKEAF